MARTLLLLMKYSHATILIIIDLYTILQSAVTHSNPSVKITVILYWIAPPRGTGSIEFLWAVVVILERNVSNIWYAPIRTAPIMESKLP